MLRKIIAVLVVVTLTACEGQQIKPEIVEPASVESAIEKGINDIANAFSSLAIIRSHQEAQLDTLLSDNDVNSLPDIWKQEVELLHPWHGELTHLVTLLSKLSGLQLPKISPHGVNREILVTFQSGTRPLINYLSDAGYQAGAHATVISDINNNQIVVQYSK